MKSPDPSEAIVHPSRFVAAVRLVPRTLLIALLASPALAQLPDSVLKREQLAEGVYLFRASSVHERWTGTNVVAVISDEDVTVFDSNTRPSTARAIIAEIKKLTNRPVRTLINSHWHMDHWSGNDEYAKAFPGIRIVATTETRGYMQRMGSRFFSEGLLAGVARSRAALDSAIQSGKLRDGSPLTPAARRQQEEEIRADAAFAGDVRDVPRVLPNLVYNDTLVFWSGRRELRLYSGTGDATGSTVLHLPAEKILVMGDVLVTQEDEVGPPPWTTNSYAITPWLNTLRRLASLDVNVIVPGQGPAFRDKSYLNLTIDLFASIIAQVHSALERGIVPLTEVQATIDVAEIGRRYTPGASTPSPRFQALVAALTRKIHQEALDGVTR